MQLDRAAVAGLVIALLSSACVRDDSLHTAYDLSHSLPIAQQRTEQLALDLGTQSSRASLGDGWSWNEGEGDGTFVWSHGPRSVVRLSIHDPRDARLILRGFPLPAEMAQTVSVSVNDAPIQSFEMQTTAADYTVAVPGVALVPGVNSIELAYAYTRSTLGERVEPRRDLGVGWHHIELQPGTSEAPESIEIDAQQAVTEDARDTAQAISDLLRNRLTIPPRSEVNYPLDVRPGSLFEARNIQVDDDQSLLLAVTSRDGSPRIVGRVEGTQRNVSIDLAIEELTTIRLSLLTTGSTVRIDVPLIRHPVALLEG